MNGPGGHRDTMQGMALIIKGHQFIQLRSDQFLAYHRRVDRFCGLFINLEQRRFTLAEETGLQRFDRIRRGMFMGVPQPHELAAPPRLAGRSPVNSTTWTSNSSCQRRLWQMISSRRTYQGDDTASLRFSIMGW